MNEAGLGDRHPRLQVDRLSRHAARGRGDATSPTRSRIHTKVAGERPLGFYQGRSSINTIRLGCEEGGFLYCADAYADDLPYWIEGPRGPQLIVPYTLDSNDMRFAAPQGFNSGDQFYAYLKDSFDTLYAEGATAPKMLSIGLHCRLVGRPAAPPRWRAFSTMSPATKRCGSRRGSTSPATGSPSITPPGGWKPSRLTRTLFVERFGGVYEHSPWIAEAAYDAGLKRGGRRRRRARQGDGARRRQGERQAEARADRRASRPRRQTRARQGADRRIDARAEERRPRSADARRAQALQRRSTPPIARASASRSSWRSRARPRPTSSRRSKRG